jgi:hypothetical protein
MNYYRHKRNKKKKTIIPSKEEIGEVKHIGVDFSTEVDYSSTFIHYPSFEKWIIENINPERIENSMQPLSEEEIKKCFDILAKFYPTSYLLKSNTYSVTKK